MPRNPALLYLAAVLGTVLIASTAIASIEIFAPKNDGHSITVIVGMAGTVLAAMLPAIISLGNSAKNDAIIAKSDVIIQQNEHLHDCAHSIKDVTMKAAKEVTSAAATLADKTAQDKKDILAAVSKTPTETTQHVDGEIKLVVDGK